MDGTLVDTEPYWMAAEVDLSAEHGGSWDESLALDLVGMSLEASAAELRARAGIRGTISEIVHELMQRVVSLVHTNGLPWRPGRSEEHTSELQSRGHLGCRP